MAPLDTAVPPPPPPPPPPLPPPPGAEAVGVARCETAEGGSGVVDFGDVIECCCDCCCEGCCAPAWKEEAKGDGVGAGEGLPRAAGSREPELRMAENVEVNGDVAGPGAGVGLLVWDGDATAPAAGVRRDGDDVPVEEDRLAVARVRGRRTEA